MSNFNYIESLLELNDFIVTKINNSFNVTQVSVELPVRPHVCPCCNTISSKIHDYRIQSIKDIPIYKKENIN